MANEDRTEKATPKHRKRSREKGQVARSSDLGGAVVLLAGLVSIGVMGPRIVASAASTFREMLDQIAHPARATTAAGLSELMHSTLSTVALAVAPIAATCMLAGVLASVAQVGFYPSLKPLKPDFRRINPVSGMRNLVGPNMVFEVLKTTAKVAVVAAVAALALLPGMTDLVSRVGMPASALGALMSSRASSIAETAAVAYLAIGLLDYGWKRFRHEKQLKMTKQQVKDETRQYGVSAEVKMAQRRRQMQAARARMMAAVPDADVVVTNPTHFAVALKYDGKYTAPLVLAKGQDLIAAQIRRVAEEHDVPVVPDPPLARALHASVEIGQIIPEELYAAVAQVLAFVYRLAGRRRLAS